MEFSVESIEGARSAIIVTDIATKFVWAIPMLTKTTEEFVERVVPMLLKKSKQTTRRSDTTADQLTLYLRNNITPVSDGEQHEANPYFLLRLRSDNEFANPQVKELFENHGYVTQTTASYDSASNPPSPR